MPRSLPFEKHHRRYEDWFEQHAAAYVSELLALRPFVPYRGRGLEIGVGSGRFAAPLGVQVGIDPSPTMLTYAAGRGIETHIGTAESLPFGDDSFDYALVVTTICFVDSPRQMLTEAGRVLLPGGRLVIGFIDRESPLGRHYLANQEESVFYREATFFSAQEVEGLLRDTGFVVESWAQTLRRPLAETVEIEAVKPGWGDCAFVVVAAVSDGSGPARAAP
ncbi:MAG: class I SAM-dependent methyltransferase [Actinomycetota bacterium]